MVGTIFDALGIPFQYCLEALTHAFNAVPPLAAIGAFGLAVVATTLIIRGALFPIFGWQLRTSRRLQAQQRVIGPQLQELRKRYKGDPQKLSAEMTKLYAEHKMSPFSSLSGCLPALVQMPVLIGLYRGISFATQHLTTGAGFLWISDVSLSPKDACCKGQSQISDFIVGALGHPWVLIIPLLAAVLTFAQSRMMMPPSRPDMSDQERTMANMTRQMSFLFPVMIFFFSFIFAQGLGIYWVTGTLFMVLQQYHLVGWGGLNVPVWFPGSGRITSLSLPRSTAPTAAAIPDKNGTNSQGSKKKPSGRAAEPVPVGVPVRPPARPPKKRTKRHR